MPAVSYRNAGRKFIKKCINPQLFAVNYLSLQTRKNEYSGHLAMPVLEKIVISDFRNIEFQELFFSPNVNCISGNNGEGKTNLLDAVYYLSMTKSSYASSDRYNFRYGTDEFSIGGTYRMQNGTESRFSVSVRSSGEKRVRRDDKPYPKVSEHIGVLPVVMVSPSDISLVSESGEGRRRFVNSVLSQTDREYLYSLQQYNRLLMQRNVMLKSRSADPGLLQVIDEKMEMTARPVFEARRKFAEALAPVVAGYYSMLSSGKESVGLAYRSDLDDGSLVSLFGKFRDRDIAMKYTTSGIQRDDFLFTMNGYPIRRCGSQGQQKSFLVALKFAQYEIMKKGYGFAPLLLLDDVFDKLDMGRISNLLAMVAGDEFGQIFITDSNKVRMSGIVDSITKDRAYFETEGGSFSRL